MNHYETSTIVSGQGEIHLAGVPFTPGTEVEIVVSPKAGAAASDQRLAALLTALDRGHNTQSVSLLRRNEIRF